MKRILLLSAFILLSFTLYAQQDPVLKTGDMRINFQPELHLIANSPLSGWYTTNVNKDIVFRENPDREKKYKLSNGEYLFFDWWFKPLQSLTLNIGYELALDYANTFYQPVNLEHDIHNKYFQKFSKEEREAGIDFDQVQERLRFWKGKADFRNNFMYARFSRGYGHPGWHNDGDIFGFYPEQWDTGNYRRISARSVPYLLETDVKLNFAGGNYGLLSFAGGPEPIWGNEMSYYAKYTYKYRLWVPTVLFKYEEIKWGRPNESLWALALTTKYYGIRRLPLEFGILFQPFRVDEEYTVTHKTGEGEGLGDSDYFVETKKTDYFDALGAKVIASSEMVPYFNKGTFAYTFLGKVAGNMHKFNLDLEKKYQPYYNITWNNTVRFPVEPPEVAIYEGTAEAMGQPITYPRDREDPFWVNSKNRDAVISSITFLYDPTPGSWIFKYYPNILELWNMNMYETSPFALIFNYNISYFPGTTDFEPYRNSLDEWLWPGEYDETAERGPVYLLSGNYPVKRPLHMFTIVGEFSVLRNGLILCIIKAGEELAQSAIAYSPSTFELTPMTRMFDISLTFFKYPFQSTVEYGHNVWGPEDWFRVVGGAIDHMYKFSLKYNLNANNEFELAYTGFRETDDKYFLNKLGPFDEFRLSYKGKFGVRFNVYPKGDDDDFDEDLEDEDADAKRLELKRKKR